MKQLSNRAILLLNGRMEAQGTPSDVINRYIGLVLEKQQSQQEKQQRFEASYRHGDGVSEILGVESAECRRAGGNVGIRRRNL